MRIYQLFSALPTVLLLSSLSPLPVYSTAVPLPAADSSRGTEDPDALPLMLRYGLLRLNIEPSGAKTVLDGQFLDQDVWLISMRPGSHSLQVRKEGFKLYEKHFEISNGDRLTFDIRLEPEDDRALPRLSQE